MRKDKKNKTYRQADIFGVMALIFVLVLAVMDYMLWSLVTAVLAGGIYSLLRKDIVSRETMTDFLIYLLILGVFLGSTVGTSRVFLFRILYILAAIFVVSLLIYGKEQQRRTFQKVITDKKLVFFYLWIAYGFLSLLWVRDFSRGFQEAGLLLKYTFLLILVLWRIGTVEKVTKLLKGLNVTFGLLMMISIWEIITGNHLSTSAVPYLPPRMAHFPTATFTNPNDYATVLVLYIPLLFSMVLVTKNLFYRLLSGLNAVLGIFIIFFVESRTNIMLLQILSLLLVAGGIYKGILFFIRRERKVLPWVWVIVPLLGIGVFWVFFGRISGVVESIYTQLQNQRGSGYIRFNLLKNGWLMTRDHYLMGVGAGNVSINMELYSEANPTFGVYPMHNLFMEILAAYGIMIFTYFIFGYGWVLGKLGQIFRQARGELRIYSGALFLGTATFILSSTAPSSVLTMRTVWLFWALAISIIEMATKANRERGG